MTVYCIEEDCKTRASCNYFGQKPNYCSTHKKDNMVDVVNKRCVDCNKIRPCFNLPDLKAKYCGDCKKDGMVDVVNKKCIVCNESIPNFNYYGLKPEYCGDCKKDGMIDVKNKKCIVCNETVPCFNYPKLKPKYCVNCKKDDMINVRDKLCINCTNHQPCFNYNGLKPLYCVNCKKDDMINVKDKMCITCNEIIPCFNYKELKPLYCVDCKEDDMINVRDKICILCNKTQARFDKYKYCSPCNATVNPDSVQGRKYRFKQNTIVDILKQHFSFDIIDKRIEDGCTNRQPDLIIDCLTHVINIEIDEDQHKSKSYTPECEEKRYDEIFTAFADRPLICIRFNPDKYIEHSNNCVWNIEGIFKKVGSSVLKIDEKELQYRIKILIQEITHFIKEIPSEIFKIKYLFYDN